MTITKQNAIAQVQNSISSIFSKEDVLFLLNNLEVGSSRKITTDDISRAIENVISDFQRNADEVVDYTSADLNISYDNRIEIESIGLNLGYITESLENNFMDFGEVAEEEDAEQSDNE